MSWNWCRQVSMPFWGKNNRLIMGVSRLKKAGTGLQTSFFQLVLRRTSSQIKTRFH